MAAISKWQGLLIGLGVSLAGGLGSAHADDLSFFKAQLAPFLKKPEFVAPGAPFDAANCMKGKSIFSIPVSSANPFTANI